MKFEQIVTDAPLCISETLTQWGRTLVVAPHPDDESLGCGGAIALLRQQQRPVHVLFVSDGSMSHPQSKKYTTEARSALREQEAKNALGYLKVASSDITFLRLPDTRVPTAPNSGERSAYFDKAVERVQQCLEATHPDTVLVPWRRDPHGDHRATWQLLRAAVDAYEDPIRWLEYPVWVWTSSEPTDLPTAADGSWFKINVRSVIDQKQRAIAAHLSQTTPLIDDDPDGFTLSPDMIGYFIRGYEYYLEPSHA